LPSLLHACHLVRLIIFILQVYSMLVLISTLWMELIIGECQELLLIKIVAITHVQVAIVILIILRLTLYLATHAILVISILIFILFAIKHDATALSHI
jgi:hypothetical protein